MSIVTRGKFGITDHVRERSVERLGIPEGSVVSYINDLMQSAIFEGRKTGKCGKLARIYFHPKTDTEMRVIGSKVVTVIERKGKLPFKTDFLRPALEREIRKIKREHTRKIRATERQLAGQYRRLGEQFVNFSNARNPQTRALIGERIEQTENTIEGVKRGIERMRDDMQAKIKAIELIAE